MHLESTVEFKNIHKGSIANRYKNCIRIAGGINLLSTFHIGKMQEILSLVSEMNVLLKIHISFW